MLESAVHGQPGPTDSLFSALSEPMLLGMVPLS